MDECCELIVAKNTVQLYIKGYSSIDPHDKIQISSRFYDDDDDDNHDCYA